MIYTSEKINQISPTVNIKSSHISIIIPVFNEEKNINLLYFELIKEIKKMENFYSWEIIFINDGSRDNSWHNIEILAKQDSRIKGISFSRNFGHQAALTAGYKIATGDIAITMDADLQDPPALISEMLKKWQDGAQIVYARRIDRNDNFLKKITALWYYKLLSHITDINMPRNVGDFRLIDKKVLEYVKHCREKSPYLRGMVAWSGFEHAYVDFKRQNRIKGTTGYTWSKMLKLAFDGVTGFSLFPLKLAAFMGVFVIITGSLMFFYISIDAFFYKINYPLFKWLVTIIYIFMGIQFLLLWVLGEYIGRIFEQQKNRPLYLINKKINLD
ncbi:MAG: glycosyltransferase family 2 protein [Candidatus Babeliales bacterium]